MTPEEQRALEKRQARLAAQVVVSGCPPLPADPHVLALDVQYAGDLAHVAGSLWRGDAHVETYVGTAPTGAPYVPGLFCFREGPPLLALVARLRPRVPGLDLLVIDGHGIAHPRRFGAACWLGLASGLPAVGCAKQPLLLSPEPTAPRGSRAPVRRGEEVVGYALRTQDGVKPVYVSPGHLIGVGEASHRVLGLGGEFRIPDPLRRADHTARQHAQGVPLGVVLGLLERVEPDWGRAS